MTERIPTPHEPEMDLIGDEFRRGVRYTNWRPHGIRDWLLIHTFGGAGRIETRRGFSIVRPGDVTLYAPDDEEDYRTDPTTGRWHLRWAHFTPKPHWVEWLRWPLDPETGLRRVHLHAGPLRRDFHAALGRMIRLLRLEIPGATDLAASAFEEALLWARVAASGDPWSAMDGRIHKAIGYVAAHLREDCSATVLARHCGLSESRFAHIFKAQTGTAPQQFVERQRMQRAGQLLRSTGLPVGEVAGEVGYADAFYFSKRFRSWTRESPSGYRAARQAVARRAGSGPA